MNSIGLVREVCTNKYLRKLALCLTIGICVSNGVVHSMEHIQNISIQGDNINQVINNIESSIQQERNRFNELSNNKKLQNAD
ncbi:MAG: hypothetical protein IJU54_02285 [Alphaproteobacteria bacterium]|nr:hypothetical protein [Alphaproteobacteria bacterium]